MNRLRILAALLSAAVVIVLLASATPAVRAGPVLVFLAWVPGAVVLSLATGRWRPEPDVPALAVGLSLVVVLSELGLLVHMALGRGAAAVLAGAALTVLLSPWPLSWTRPEQETPPPS